MAVLKHTYLECHDAPTNAHKFYLVLLIQEASTYKTLAYYARIGNAAQVASKYQGPSRSSAEAAFDKIVWDKSHKRGEPNYEPATLPSNLQAEINRLNAQTPAAAAAPSSPRPAPAPARPAPSRPAAPAPARPAAPAANPLALPSPVMPRPVDASTFAAALASASYVATASAGLRMFLVIPARGQAQLIECAKYPQPGSLNRFPALVASLDPANPVLADTVFDGEAAPNGASLRLWDIIRYRGNDLAAYPLTSRLALLHQAVNELAREGQLNAAWGLADAAQGPAKDALARSAGSATVLRDLAAPYDQASVTAALRRA